MAEPVHINGTTLEGGGQLVRIALALSSLTSIPIHISKIRGGRPGGGGLKLQHLTAVKWLASATHAAVQGAEVKSKELEFAPSTLSAGSEGTTGAGEETEVGLEFYVHDLHTHNDGLCGMETHIPQSTPGAIGLVLQSLLSYIYFAGHSFLPPSTPAHLRYIILTITGGTNVSLSPSYDYIDAVLLPILVKIGLPMCWALLKERGWSTGRNELGRVSFVIKPLEAGTTLPAFQLQERGKITKIEAIAIVPRNLDQHVRETLYARLYQRLPDLFDVDGEERVEFEYTSHDSRHPKRLYLLLVAHTSTDLRLGRDWLYDARIGNTMRDIENAGTQLVHRVVDDLNQEIESGACVDEYMRDQLVVYQALAKGRSYIFNGERDGRLVQPSLHAKTAEWVCGEILGERVEFDGKGVCEGAGFTVGETFADRSERQTGVRKVLDGVEDVTLKTYSLDLT